MTAKPVACAVVGAMGRMGQRICGLIAQSPEFTLAAAVENPDSPAVGKKVRDLTGIPGADAVVCADLSTVRAPFDVIIDFTFPEVSLRTAAFAADARRPAVIGSTGFTAKQRERLRRSAEAFPCVCAPNMSLGVNALFALVRHAARMLHDGYDAEVVEIHHRHKKDAPSGTALRIAQILAESYGWSLEQTGVYARRGMIGERRREEIGIQSLRAGDVVGEHTVLFAGIGERVELVHRAQSRDCFARGALHAARWVLDKPAGLYDMQDVLGLA